jgi:hypothetical protein
MLAVQWVALAARVWLLASELVLNLCYTSQFRCCQQLYFPAVGERCSTVITSTNIGVLVACQHIRQAGQAL